LDHIALRSGPSKLLAVIHVQATIARIVGQGWLTGKSDATELLLVCRPLGTGIFGVISMCRF
jgi:hypothetical protein